MFTDDHEAKVGQPSQTQPDQTRKRIELLEADLEKHRLLSGLYVCLLFLVAVHALAFTKLIGLSFKWNAAFPAWIAAGGIGSLAVWFAFTARPLFHRILVSTTVLIGVHLGCGASLSYIALSQDSQSRSNFSRVSNGAVFMIEYYPSYTFDPNGVKNNRSSTMLIGWMLGSFLAAYCCTWFTGFRLAAPGMKINKRMPLSIRSMFVMTIVAAIASQFLSRQYFARQAFHYSHGLTVGLLAAAAAWAVFSNGGKRLLVPFGVAMLVILGDVTLGWLVGAWRGSLLARFQEIVLFTLSISVSPLATFSLLKHFGYEKV